jgi:hypothetical protein
MTIDKNTLRVGQVYISKYYSVGLRSMEIVEISRNKEAIQVIGPDFAWGVWLETDQFIESLISFLGEVTYPWWGFGLVKRLYTNHTSPRRYTLRGSTF